MAELYGKEGGCVGGKGGSMHMFSKELEFYGGHGIVGGQIGVGTGMAYAAKYKDSGQVVLCFFGEAAVNQGIFHESLNMAQLWKRFPAWNPELYRDGVLEIEAGYAESSRTVAMLIERAKSVGVELHERVTFAQLDERGNRVSGLALDDGRRIAADFVVMAVGAWTPYLLPFTKEFFRATGQPVFHLKPSEPELFAPERFPVFGADITTTGYYGFPTNRDGVVKIANHGPGREMSPDSPARGVTAEDETHLREFLASTFPSLADAPILYTRMCMYCDTHDGHFWIARDPEREGLVVAAGDSGHGFKFAPVLGEIIADAVEGKDNPLLEKFRWRPEVHAGAGTDAARFQLEERRSRDRRGD